MMIVYTFVFSTFLKVRFGSDDSPFTFAVYLLCGLLPWNAFSEGILQSTSLIRTNQNLVKRVLFPLEILPFNLTVVTVIQQLFGLALLIPFATLITQRFSFVIGLLPIVLFFQFLFFSGANWIWASLSVYFPDLRQLTPLLIMMLMFITPIFYPQNLIPAQAHFVVELNPMARIIEIYRSIFMEGNLPNIESLLITALMCVLVFLLGYFWFMRSKPSFPDNL